ncbi:MAG: glycosyl hydrolase family 3 [Gammaproteobacteria bacterium]|nr:glycosyl hydrolase family 3 [Gammaproteobacteria bacterium]
MNKIDQIINRLSLKEKVTLLSGFNSWYSNKIDDKNIPSIKMSDGPNGVRGDSNSGKSSACFPCAVSISSSWDLEQIQKVGVALGEEAKAKDVDVLLGPTINIHRHPLGGRHFESFSEDPFLTGKVATQYVCGVQSQDVAACLKHFVGNDTEFERHSISSNIDEQTLREIYLLPFEMGIKDGNAKVVMSAYNKLNDVYCSSHQELLLRTLKSEWGFDGYVVSDWGAALETIENANGGLDLEMPGPGNVWGKSLIEAVKKNQVSEDLINDKVKRILSVAKFTKRFENPNIQNEQAIDNPNHRKIIRKAAADGMVLLKNDDLLPLRKDIKKIAIIGPNAKESQIIGGGSASLKPHYQIHPLEAIQKRIMPQTEVLYSKGCHTHKYLPKINEKLMKSSNGFLVEYFDGDNFNKNLLFDEHLIGSKFWVFEGFAKEIISKEERSETFVRFSCDYIPNISGKHEFEIFGIGQCRMLIDNEEIIDNWNNLEPGEAFFTFGSASRKGIADFKKGKNYKIEIQYYFKGNFPAVYIGCQPPDEIDLFTEALEIASESDQVILIVGTNSDWETEGNDRADFNLPAGQNKLIEAILDKNENTVLVINTGSPINMPWEHKTKTILQTWFAGQEFGNALFDILSGEVNPSGKLPTSFPKNIEDTPAFNSYPGKNLQMDYEEKLLVGYKWYEKHSIKPLFCFGHGLSYTKFKYENLKVISNIGNKVSCKFYIKNIGGVAGLETAQCYVGHESPEEDQPIRTLQGFCKVSMNANEGKNIEINLTERNFSFWSTASKSWQIRGGTYKIFIGSSIENIYLTDSITLDPVLKVL